jgi:hypothetical protein
MKTRTSYPGGICQSQNNCLHLDRVKAQEWVVQWVLDRSLDLAMTTEWWMEKRSGIDKILHTLLMLNDW